MNTAQHLWTWLSGKKTYAISIAGIVYAWGIQKNLWAHDQLTDFLLGGGAIASLRHGWKTEAAKIVQAILTAPPPVLTVNAPVTVANPTGLVVMPTPRPTSGAINLATMFTIFGAVAICCIPLLMLPGCAGLAPGADPFIVRIEQAESSAKPGFDFLLSTENANRDFFKTNAVGFSDFCEWLRQPQPVTGMTAFGTNIAMNLPRASAMQWNLDQIKGDYKQGKATSNSVFTVLATLEGAVVQAVTWTSVLTNSAAMPPH